MLKHKYTDTICIAVIALAVLLTIVFMNGEKIGLIPASSAPAYVSRLFDDSRVHTIDLQVENWNSFLENAPKEEYISCDVVIDGEKFRQIGLRAKGNNSKRLTEEYELARYSLKLEFDRYQKGYSYHGLDKFSLDSSFQDNSYMKTFLTYDMMRYMQVPTPLCSYVWVMVNGTPWGLFLAIEEPEEAFARRNFGNHYGQLYKPEYRKLDAENADVDLRYVDDNPSSYENIFRKAKFDVTKADQMRLIQSLKILSDGENLTSAVNIDEVLRYFAVQVFVLNLDSYIGSTGHNYFLYEENGILSILPWDYNLAFGTYCLGMTNPIKDPNIIINYPVNTPWKGEDMLKRPLFHNVMKNDTYFSQYRAYMQQFIREYMNDKRCENKIVKTFKMIAPYVKEDPMAFCRYEDFVTAADTLLMICKLRAESIQGQLDGKYPATLASQAKNPDAGVYASHINIADLGDFEDLRKAKERQQAYLKNM